jgi:hypothetical protein
LGDDVYDAAVDLALRLGVDVRDPVVDDEVAYLRWPALRRCSGPGSGPRAAIRPFVAN